MFNVSRSTFDVLPAAGAVKYSTRHRTTHGPCPEPNTEDPTSNIKHRNRHPILAHTAVQLTLGPASLLPSELCALK